MARVGVGAGRWMAIVAAGLMVAGSLAVAGANAATSILPCPKGSGSTYATASVANVGPRPMNPCPGYEWAKAFGYLGQQDNSVTALSVDGTSDNGAVMLARRAADGPLPFAAVVVRLDANGTVLWQREFEGSGINGGTIRQTGDGGFVFVTSAAAGMGSYDVVVFRMDTSGVVLWQKAYGGTGVDAAKYVEETSGGGFIVGGETSSFGAGGKDLWILRLDATGGLVWQHAYGGPGDECFYGVSQTADSGYVAGGQTNCNGEGNPEAWVLRLDSAGGIVWQKLLRASGFASPIHGVRPAADGGFIVSMASGYKWAIVKLTASGAISWQRTYGSTGVFRGSVMQTADGGYVASASLSTKTNGFDLAVLRIDDVGNLIWQRTYGGSAWEYPCGFGCIDEAPDGNLLVAGSTTSFMNGKGSAWLLRLFSDGSISSTCDPGFGTHGTSPSMSLGKLKASAAGYGGSTATVSSLDLAVPGSAGSLSVETQCTA